MDIELYRKLVLTSKDDQHDLARKALYLTPEPDAAQALRHKLAARSITVESTSQLGQGLEWMRTDRQRPAALLLDTRLLEGATDADAIARLVKPLGAFNEGREDTALIVIAHQHDIRFRLMAMRANARHYLVAPLNIAALAERILTVIETGRMPTPRVLIVDDQQAAAQVTAKILEAIGMITHQVNEPLQIMAALEHFSPDLVLMDLHMPSASGIEVTAIIREQEEYAELPIVFLSAESDPSQQIAALRFGGNDFLIKPVTPTRLISCVRGALQQARERKRRLCATFALDAETGLVSHERLSRRLDQLIALHAGQHPGDHASSQQTETQRILIHLAFSATDIDPPKLARAIDACIPGSELIARIDQETVAILPRRAPRESLERAITRLDAHLAASFTGLRFGLGWCEIDVHCPDSPTLLSRVSKVAAQSLARGCGPVGYVHLRQLNLDSAGILALISSGNLTLLFEPILGLKTPIIARYAVHPHLQMNDGELLAADEFLPMLDDRSAARAFDDALLKAALDVMSMRIEQEHPVKLFVPQLSASLGDPDWIEHIRDQIGMRNLVAYRPILQFRSDEIQAES